MSLKACLKKLAPEFGYLGEEVDREEVENDLLNKLDRANKLDEVDTVTFGLETDDGKIVKVYVKADQADDFEKALSTKLGEVDDIEEALNELAKDFEIVDVEWPDENVKPEEDEEGSESMNSKIYDNDDEAAENAVKPKASFESMTFGERASLIVMEDSSTIESRFTTPAQLMIYHAIVELGIPEIALARNPYRAAIIKGIKDKSRELARSTTQKQALKLFIKRAVDFEHQAQENEKNIQGVDEALEEATSQQDFWGLVTKLISYVTGNQEVSQDLLTSAAMKALISGSSSPLGTKINSQIKAKLEGLSTALDGEMDSAQSAKLGIPESYSNQVHKKLKETLLKEGTSITELTTLFTSLFTLADPTPNGDMVNAVMKSSQMNQVLQSAREGMSSKFQSQARTQLNGLISALSAAVPAKTTTAAPQGNQQTASAQQAATTQAAGPQPAAEGLTEDEEQETWSFDSDDDNFEMMYGNEKILLDPEQSEKLIKGISNHDTVVVKDAKQNRKYVFSPRGISVLIKVVGESTTFKLGAKDIDKLLTAVGSHAAKVQ